MNTITKNHWFKRWLQPAKLFPFHSVFVCAYTGLSIVPLQWQQSRCLEEGWPRKLAIGTWLCVLGSDDEPNELAGTWWVHCKRPWWMDGHCSVKSKLSTSQINTLRSQGLWRTAKQQVAIFINLGYPPPPTTTSLHNNWCCLYCSPIMYSLNCLKWTSNGSQPFCNVVQTQNRFRWWFHVVADVCRMDTDRIMSGRLFPASAVIVNGGDRPVRSNRDVATPRSLWAHQNNHVRWFALQSDHNAQHARPHQTRVCRHRCPSVLSTCQDQLFTSFATFSVHCLRTDLYCSGNTDPALSVPVLVLSEWMRSVDEQIWFPMARFVGLQQVPHFWQRPALCEQHGRGRGFTEWWWSTGQSWRGWLQSICALPSRPTSNVGARCQLPERLQFGPSSQVSDEHFASRSVVHLSTQLCHSRRNGLRVSHSGQRTQGLWNAVRWPIVRVQRASSHSYLDWNVGYILSHIDCVHRAHILLGTGTIWIPSPTNHIHQSLLLLHRRCLRWWILPGRQGCLQWTLPGTCSRCLLKLHLLWTWIHGSWQHSNDSYHHSRQQARGMYAPFHGTLLFYHLQCYLVVCAHT